MLCEASMHPTLAMYYYDTLRPIADADAEVRNIAINGQMLSPAGGRDSLRILDHSRPQQLSAVLGITQALAYA
jgi:hypothetical protein